MSAGYKWDRRKARSNLQKHGVDFADAALVLENPMALTMPDPDFEAEDRFLTVGSDPRGRVLVVAYTWRGDTVRIISARKATRRERRQYEEI
jgi:uncharacterized DUF497 family protein